MPRLYYDKPPGTGTMSSATNNTKEFGGKVAKLIPVEIIAGYLPLIGLVEAVKLENLRPGLYILVFVVCLAMVPIYLNWQSEKDKPKRVHIIVSTLAFPIWAYAVSGHIILPQFYDGALANIILGLFTLITGWIPLKS